MSAEDVTVTKPPAIGAALAKKHRSPEAVVEYITEGDDLITGMGNSERSFATSSNARLKRWATSKPLDADSGLVKRYWR